MLLIPVDNEHQRNCSFCQAVRVEIEKLIVFMLLSLSGEPDCPIQFLITLVFNSGNIINPDYLKLNYVLSYTSK